MKTRVEKYKNDNENYIPKRTRKNEQLYEEIKDSELENFSIGMNAKVIGENPNQIDIDKIKEILEKNYQDPPKRRSIEITKEEESLEQLELEKTREYDINAILEKAREEKEVDYQEERLKKVRDTQYDILKNLDLDDNKAKASSKKTKDELLELINTIELNEYQKKQKAKQQSSDDLDPLDILSDLKGNDGTVVVEAQDFEKEMATFEMKMNTKEEKMELPKEELKVVVEEDKEKTSEDIDKSFYTDSMTFNKDDFDSFTDVDAKGSVLVKVLIVIIFLAIIGGIVLFLNDFLKLGWF